MSYRAKKIEKQLTRGLLDIVVLGFLRSKPMHGYKIIVNIRKEFGVYFGPSTIYPHLIDLEKNGLIKSQWEINCDRPRKIYNITPEGLDILYGSENTLTQICHRLNTIGLQRINYHNNLAKLDNQITNHIL